MTLDGGEFLRRFLLHVLPTGFVRIRYFGLFANRVCNKHLARCRELLAPLPGADTPPAPASPSTPKPADEDQHLCPSCGIGQLHWVAILPRAPMPDLDAWAPTAWDTS